MARQKQPALILSFARTIDAMAVERYCKKHDLPGRIIPVPREITAGCGLAWKAAPEDEEILVAALQEANLLWSGKYILEI